MQPMKNGSSTLLDRKKESLGSPDEFQTPEWPLDALLPYLPSHWRIWEPAAGAGNLVRGLQARGYSCTGTDILTGGDFFHPRSATFCDWDCHLTNPPFSRKDDWLVRCYDLDKPFVLLLPVTCLEGKIRQALYRRNGIQVICLPRRVNFTTPSGEGGGAWFPVCWFCWRLNLPSDLIFWQEESAQGALF